MGLLCQPGGNLWPTANFNDDGKPDYVLYNPATRQTAIWYLNNNIYMTAVVGLTLPVSWSLVSLADFNRDRKNRLLTFQCNHATQCHLVFEQ